MMRSTTLIPLVSGGTVSATSEHAWPKPRGEVYLSVNDGEGEDEGGYEGDMTLALTPVEAEVLIDALQAALTVAKLRPEATIDAEAAWREVMLREHAQGEHGGGVGMVVPNCGACPGASE